MSLLINFAFRHGDSAVHLKLIAQLVHLFPLSCGSFVEDTVIFGQDRGDRNHSARAGWRSAIVFALAEKLGFLNLDVQELARRVQMVALNSFFDARGYAFEQRLAAFRKAYELASAALRGNIEQLHKSALEYEASEEFVGERDEDGHVLWDMETLLNLERDAAEEGIMALRKAFVISIYHHWERSIGRFTIAPPRADHDKLVKLAKKKKVAIHEKLCSVRYLVNTLKHSNDDRGNELLGDWPDVLGGSHERPAGTDWYEEVRLTDDHVSQAFTIIEQSGPRSGVKI